MLIFSNPGEIDPRLITTFGTNVKVGESPIGHFGTGLKYAIAVVLRIGGSISIQSGASRYDFGLQPDTIRGKFFEFVTMNGEPVGFTTELGKDWEPWMAYRELWSNAKDEGGNVFLSSGVNSSAEAVGETFIFVSGLDEVYKERYNYFLDPMQKPIVSSDFCDIYYGLSDSLFYQGIKVATLDKPSLYTYDLKFAHLTEDRTLSSLTQAKEKIAFAICQAHNNVLITNTILSKKHFEAEFSWHPAIWAKRSPEFEAAVIAAGRNKSVELPTALLTVFKDLAPEDSMPQPVVPTALESRVLTRAFNLLERLGWTIVNEIVVVESLGEAGESSITFGLAFDSKIWISRAAFRKGLHAVMQVLLEEHLHLQMGYDDCSRNMQNYLFEHIIRLGGEVLEEIL